MHRSHTLPRIVLLVLACHSVASAEEIIRVQNRDEFAKALSAAKAGTVISVAPGAYRGGLSHSGLRGTKERPIVIAGADAKNPPLIEGGGSGLQLSSPQHVELRDLIISKATGNGLNIDDSGSTDTPAHDLMLRNIIVRDVGPAGNRDGIKLSGLRNFRIEGCKVERWGSGGSAIDMVGCHAGVIAKCTFAEATGDGASGVQAKGGSSQITIQRCRFENAGGRGVNIGGSTGLPYFRPRDASYEAKDITVEDCEFIGGMSAVAFVGVDGAVVRNNTVYRPTRWAIRILQESTDARFVPCRNGRFLKNVVAFQSDEVRQVVNIGGQTAPDTFEFAGNVWYCLDRPADTQRLVRLPTEEQQGTYAADPGFKDARSGDLRIENRGADSAGVRSEQRPK